MREIGIPEPDPASDTYIDGCGVFWDTPIGEGTHIRLQLDKDRQQDISIYVEDGILHVLGMYRPLIYAEIEENHIVVDTKRWRSPNDRDENTA